MRQYYTWPVGQDEKGHPTMVVVVRKKDNQIVGQFVYGKDPWAAIKEAEALITKLHKEAYS